MGPMLHPVRHEDHLDWIDPDLAVLKVHAQPTGPVEQGGQVVGYEVRIEQEQAVTIRRVFQD